jgi:Ca2+-transporting ATPase
MEWYQQSPEEVAQSLDTSLTSGLSSGSAQSKLETFGPNELKEQEGKSFLQKLIAQFSDFLILILIAAALISVFVGEAKDAIVIMSIVIVNALLGLYQEGKAEKALEALKKMASPTAKVLRDGNPQEISSSQLVPGDLVILETGDIIPADLRLVESSNLKVEEASLTGESVPVEKRAQETYSEEVSLGDRHNMAYMSTIITYGRGKGVVVETAEGTEIGKIAAMIQTFEEEPTPLQKKLNQLGKVLGMTTIAVCVAVFGIGLLQGREVLEMFMVSISLAVAAIPEGLPAIVTIVLAIGMNKMVERNAIVKKLLAVENEMTVVKVLADNKLIEVEGTGYEPVGDFKLEGSTITTKESSGLKLLLTIAALANDAKLDNSSGMYRIIGDPTEGALVTLAGKAGIDSAELNHMYKRIEEIPFDSERKMMTTFHDMPNDEGVSSFTKGAPDIIIGRCNRIILDGRVREFTPELKSEVLRVNSDLSRAALRVLAFAFKEYASLPADPSPDKNESDMIFVGLTGMIDPPRPEARDAIALCKKAGVNAIMITGDYKETAFAIAKDLGMAETEDQAMMGEKLDGLSDEELQDVVKNTKVFARVSPEHKVRIVSALRANGDIAAMTGRLILVYRWGSQAQTSPRIQLK